MIKVSCALFLLCAELFADCPPTFSPPITIPVGPRPRMGLVKDLNGDGHSDIAIPDHSDKTLRVLLGDGKAGFSQTAILNIGDGGTSVDSADFDCDGILDLAVSHQFVKKIFLYKGIGNGNFAFKGSLPQPGQSFRLRTADVNKDGKPDIVVSLNTFHTVRIFFGNGIFSFSQTTDLALNGKYPHDILVTDLNGDGKPDIAAILSASTAISVRLGNGDGTFQPVVKTEVGHPFPVGLAAADFNNDGNIDLAISRVDSSEANLYSIAYGNGSGAFPALTTFATQMTAWSVAACDMDGNEKSDIILPGKQADSLTIYGNDSPSFSAETVLQTGAFPFWVGTADFNEDAEPDIIEGNFEGGTLMIFLKTSTFSSLKWFTLSLNQLNKGQQNSLATKLDGAKISYESGKKNASCGKLDSFINEVTAFGKSGMLDEAIVATLIAAANAIKCAIGCD